MNHITKQQKKALLNSLKLGLIDRVEYEREINKLSSQKQMNYTVGICS